MQIETLKWLARHLPGKTIVWDVPGHLIVQAMKMEKARAANTGREPKYNQRGVYQGKALVSAEAGEVN